MDRYDLFAYDSMPVAEADPARIVAVGRLMGLSPPANWRVLEIGCGAGGHVVPLAARSPGDRWVAFDRAEAPIAAARSLAAALGADVHLEQLDLLAAVDRLRAPGLPEAYDVIIAHGVYSWVPPEVQRALLSLCGALLAPEGVAYVSANTYPGWGQRGAFAKMLQYVAGSGPPAEQVGRARAFAKKLVQWIPANDPYGAWLRREEALVREHGDSWVFHDLLAEVNQPVWLHTFVDDARSHGLQYLGDACWETMLPDRLPEAVRADLDALGGGQIEREQLMDFVLGRSFRRLLLCRAERTLRTVLEPDAIDGLWVRGRVVREGPGRFRSLDGDELQTDSPLLQAVIGRLADERPRALSVAELADIDVGGRDPERVRRNLLLAASRGLVELRARPDGLVGLAGTHPRGERVAQRLAAGGAVPSALGQRVRLDELSRRLLLAADGHRDLGALAAAVADGGFSVPDADGGPASRELLLGWLRLEIPRRLVQLAREGLLEA